MKKLGVLLLFILITNLTGSYINLEKDLKTAKKKAISLKKKLLVLYTWKSCPECNYMKYKVLKDEKIISYINENFVSISFDVEKDREKLPFKRFNAIPVFYFVDAKDMNIVTKHTGGLRAKKLLSILEKAK